MREHKQSNKLFEEAKKVMPGGVNSPVRAYKSVGSNPVFITRGAGPNVFDEDGNKYIDYVMSWGPLILGHAYPDIVEALREVIEKGTSFGAPTVLETELASLIIEALPAVEKVRMVNSGTEAVMTAIRLARGYTGRTKIVKMEGCYHGHSDSLLIKAGSGLSTLGIPGSPGVPDVFARETISLPFNNMAAIEKVFKDHGEDIAAVILEPIPANMGVILPRDGYLSFLREITRLHGSLLIFDEVITGFRVGYGGAQEVYGIEPDLTCLGKIIGGGLPVGAYGGKKEIMGFMAPEGPVYQAGTLSGNPLAMTAGITTLKKLKEKGIYKELKEKTDYLVKGMKEISMEKGLAVQFNSHTGLFSQFFTPEKVVDYDTALKTDQKVFKEYFKGMLARGIYLAPSPFEATFLSLAHRQEDLDQTLEVYQQVVRSL